MTRQIYVPSGGPGQITPPSREIYAHMGEENIFKMLEDFYLELEQSSIRHMFPKDVVEASKKSAAFFVGLMGGGLSITNALATPPCALAICHSSLMSQRVKSGSIALRRYWQRLLQNTIFLKSICPHFTNSSKHFHAGW